MNSRSALALVLVASGLHIASRLAAADPAPPDLRLPNDARPVAVSLDLTLVPDRETFAGEIGIDLEILRPTRLLWLNGQDLEIDAATLTVDGNSSPARYIPGGEEFVGFDFGREIQAGKARLEISYRGKIDPVETEGIFRQKDRDQWYIFSQFESTFARRAFPGFDEPSFRNSWKLTLHVPAGHRAFANSPQVAERPEPDGMQAVEFAPTRPFSSYLVAFAVGPFSVIEGGVWGASKTPFRVLVPRGHEGRAGYAAEVTGPLLAQLEEYFGIPYPFTKLDNLTIPQTVQFGAMENPGLITYVDRLLLSDPAQQTLERQQTYAEVAAHENAHQWFGNLVTMKWWDDIWLNEGFATWMAQKIVAEWKPEWGIDNEISTRRSKAMGADSLASSQPVRRPIRNAGDIVSAFDGISYQKGGALLSMFEGWMGAEKFRAGIQGYLKKHSWGNATSDDFLAALAVEGGPAVAKAFASFLDQPGVPVVSAALRCDGNKAVAELAQRRYVPLGSPASSDAAWQVPVNLLYGSGDRIESTRLVLDEKSEAATLKFCPEWLQVNDGGVGYYVTELKGPLFAAFAKRAPTLPTREQIAFLGDSSFLFGSGDLGAAATLGVIPGFASSTNRLIGDAVIDLALMVEDNYFDERLRPNYERYLRQTFGARARQLGFHPRAGESVDDTLLRPDLIKVVGDAGADPEIRAEARRLTEAWLVDPQAVSADMVPTVLRISAREGDVAYFDRMVAAAEKEQDRRTRQQILRSLGSLRDPAAVDKALALLLSGKFDIREAAWVLFDLSGDRASKDKVFDWVEATFDALAAAMPEQYAASLAYTAASFCDEAHRKEIRDFFEPRAAKLTGGPNNLDEVLDIVGICIGRKAKHSRGVEEFLAPY